MAKKFMFFCDDGVKMSKLDRILVYSNFMAVFPSSSVLALPREYSDHCPILLRTSIMNFSAHPFRFFNSWIHRDGLELLNFDTSKVEMEKENILFDLKRKVDEIELEAENMRLSDSEIEFRRDSKQKKKWNWKN